MQQQRTGEYKRINNQQFTSTGTYECQVGIEEASEETAVKRYPNPLNNILHIAMDNGSALRIEVYNITGILVAQAANSDTIDLSKLPSGLYIVKIYAADCTSTQHTITK